MTYHEAAGGPADVDPVVAVSGMAENPFVFFVKGVHGRPGERDPRLQLARVVRQVDVLPCPSRSALLACSDDVPGGESEVGVPRGVVGGIEGVWRDIGLRKVGYRIAAGLEEQDYVFAIGDPGPAEAHAHAAPQRLG